MVNASGEDWRSWINAVISAVSVKTNPLAGYVGADLPTIKPRIRHAPTNAAGTVCSNAIKLIVPQQGSMVEEPGEYLYLES
jgi:hypothetical protein